VGACGGVRGWGGEDVRRGGGGVGVVERGTLGGGEVGGVGGGAGSEGI